MAELRFKHSRFSDFYSCINCTLARSSGLVLVSGAEFGAFREMAILEMTEN